MLVQTLLPTGLALLAGSTATPLNQAKDIQTLSPGPAIKHPVVDLDRIASMPLPDILHRSAELINKLYQEPTCKQYAAAALISECASITHASADTPSNVRELLDIERSLFAVRVTVCDLQRDKMDINATCQAFLPGSHSKASQPKKRSYFSWSAADTSAPPSQRDLRFEEASATDRESCLASLGNDKNGIGWTTYTHNYHQAGAVCHALRSDVERDDIVGMVRVLGDVLGDYGEILKSNKEELLRASRDWSELQLTVRQHFLQQSDANRDLAAHFREELAAWLTDIGTSLQSAKDTADELNDDIDRADSSVKRLKDTADSSLDKLLDHTNVAVKESKDNIIISSNEVISFFQQDISAKLEQFLGKTAQELEARHREQVARHDVLDRRLQATSDYVEEFKAEVISAAQVAAKEAAEAAAKEHASQSWAWFTGEGFRFLRTGLVHAAYFAFCFSAAFSALWKTVGLSCVTAMLIAFWAGALFSYLTAGLFDLAPVQLFVSTNANYILLAVVAITGIWCFVVIVRSYVLGSYSMHRRLLTYSLDDEKFLTTASNGHTPTYITSERV